MIRKVKKRKRKKDLVERIMEQDEDDEQPNEKKKKSKMAQREQEQTDLIHQHKQAITWLIGTSNWRHIISLRDLKESVREMLGCANVALVNKTFHAALKEVESEMMSSASTPDSGKEEMEKKFSLIKLMLNLVKPDLHREGAQAPAKCLGAHAFSECAQEAVRTLDTALDLKVCQVTPRTGARIKTQQFHKKCQRLVIR